MTGFGRQELARDGRRIRVEVKSVNHRFLDISIRAPRFISRYDGPLREVLKRHLHRGHVDVSVVYASEREDAEEATVDLALARAYADGARQIAQATGIDNDVTISTLLQLGDVVSCEISEEEAEAAGPLLLEAAEAACTALVEERAREGAHLWEDIRLRIGVLQGLADVIEEQEPQVVLDYQQRLAERITELMGQAPVDEQRIAQEIALFADKCNVTEEITRIRSHLQRLASLGDAGGAQGRSMDFIAQELNREFNTIGSKSQDTHITNAVLDGKAEVEKIREQIQNIE